MLERFSCLVVLGVAACVTTRSGEFNDAGLAPGAVGEAFRSEYGWRHSWARDRDDQGDWWFEHKTAGSRILVVAAHTEAEYGTAGLAYALALHARVNAIYGVRKAPLDPLQAEGGEFEEALTRLIDAIGPTLIVDLRADGMHAADVDFGTGNGEWTRGSRAAVKLAGALRTEGVENLTRDARSPGSGYASRLSRKAPYLRLSVNRSRLPVLMDVDKNPNAMPLSGSDAAQAQRFAQLLQGLVRGLRALDSTE